MKKPKPKPRTKREAAGTESAAVTAKPAQRRKRTGNVRGTILSLLEAGPMPTSELVSKGKFSLAAAFLNLKALRNEGAIAAARQGREVFYSLSGTAPVGGEASAAPGGARRRGRPAKAAGARAGRAGGAGSLNAALDGISKRFAGVDALKTKLSVLDQLAGNLPSSVSTVLKAIRADLQRFA